MPRLKRLNPPHVQRLLRQIAIEKPYEKEGRKPTASTRALRTIGRMFIERFPTRVVNTIGIRLNGDVYESPIGIHLTVGGPTMPVLRASAKIGFDCGAVIIEGIQGVSESGNELKQATERLGKPWPNYLLEMVEENARACGFHQVRIRRPETLYWVQQPVQYNIKSRENEKITNEAEKRALQKQIIGFYAIIAKKMKYKKQGDYYVKEL